MQTIFRGRHYGQEKRVNEMSKEYPVWLFCQICGHKMNWKTFSLDRVCMACREEFVHRETLHIHNKPYRLRKASKRDE